MEGLKVKWRKTDSETLVHLYQDGERRPESQQQDYHERAHFFTDQIQHGNFSLRMDNLRAEDEGQYTCEVYSQQDSGETVVQLNLSNVGFSVSRIMVLILCISASVSALLLGSMIYCRSQNTNTVLARFIDLSSERTYIITFGVLAGIILDLQPSLQFILLFYAFGSVRGGLYRVVPVYVFGSVGVVLLNSITLMTELILKTVNGDHAVGDLRVIVFPSECLFIFPLLFFRVFNTWMETAQQKLKIAKSAEVKFLPAAGNVTEETQSESVEPQT
ncbi:Myelin-oligodendrocyte glycoprotein [Labeo rohita]|uniref:Myelin-oligodendrocyte glycoprotein n=1 Tax=Labeo rohita TaxID=84645 RepID=A0ABQ8LCA5_LABRO|nr:Myelin-oligodendrocyte glycoprotein [Labeo rohita]